MVSQQLPSTADYIIVGGGTAGLVVAARLSENPDVHVVVLESGPDATEDPRVQNPALWHGLSGSELDWKVQVTPQPGWDNRDITHVSGKAIGGSSSVNGLLYIPPSPNGIDAWAKLGNSEWTWESLQPYWEKTIAVTPPEHATHITTTPETTSGTIKVTYPALENKSGLPLIQAWHDTFKSKGYDYQTEMSFGRKVIGTRDYAGTVDPVSGLRSGAASEYGTVAAARPNVTIVTEATVQRILFESYAQGQVATGAEIVHNNELHVVHATKEIIMAAGGYHTPKILELSGIGSQDKLDEFNIPVIIDLPGVGENYQSHPMVTFPFSLKRDSQAMRPAMMAVAFPRLNSEERAELLSIYDGDKDKHASGKVLKSLFESPDDSSAFYILGVLPGNMAVIAVLGSFPFSRGSVHISSDDPSQLPAVDAGIGHDAFDIEILARHSRNLFKMTTSEPLNSFLQNNGEHHDLETIKDQIRATGSAAHHVCGTTAMLPQEDGGVVDQNLTVYGTQNLRVVDASIFPIIPHANPISTVYAVAERAADLIRGN
ncbi:glucose-methanol-choline (gmc) oxidoreductase [Penicillium angulare]|uniref:glucose-methanol-choline (gmc) oxidoreductase n=1 Tax=Penicillium angulare TaxID=116970 RepID=UPI00253F663E|nr:glucose-methanol-choline (gmc) oxidoreductase [Penicillium angulare]KAJ5290902.1 glucose-methanol-choline (gmc) oxidoreductase [Penicillium angulare]